MIGSAEPTRLRASLRTRVGVTALAAASLVAAASAPAQTLGTLLGTEIPFDINRGNNESVLERRHPEIEPLGVRGGGFLLFPSIEVGPGFTNNVYGQENGAVSDGFATISPRVELQSNWNRHSLDVRATGNFKRFIDSSLKNETGYNVAADGRLDVFGEDNVTLSMDYGRSYLAQYSGAFPSNAAASVPLDRFRAAVRGTFTLNRLRFIVNTDVATFDFFDTLTLDRRTLDQDYRDSNVVRFSGRGEYALSPDTALFVQGTYSLSDYTSPTNEVPSRSGSETRILAGVTFDLTRVARAAIGIGYLSRAYDSPIYPGIGALAADVRLEYFPSQLTTISLQLRRETQDAIIATSPGYVVTEAQVRVDHELLRNVLLYAQAGYEHDDFKNITRRDNLASFTVGGNYTPFRNLVLNPDVQYISRKSNGDFFGQRFNEFRAIVRTTVRI